MKWISLVVTLVEVFFFFSVVSDGSNASTGLNFKMCSGSMMVKSSIHLSFFMLVLCGRYI